MTHFALSLASEIRDLLASDMQTTGCWNLSPSKTAP
jgi:hypothetical protein